MVWFSPLPASRASQSRWDSSHFLSFLKTCSCQNAVKWNEFGCELCCRMACSVSNSNPLTNKITWTNKQTWLRYRQERTVTDIRWHLNWMFTSVVDGEFIWDTECVVPSKGITFIRQSITDNKLNIHKIWISPSSLWTLEYMYSMHWWSLKCGTNLLLFSNGETKTRLTCASIDQIRL